MVEKIEEFLSRNYGCMPIFIVLALWIVAIPTAFLVSYKKPLALSDNDDKDKIIQMIEEQHGACQIKDLTLVTNTVYPAHTELIKTMIKDVEDMDDVLWYTNNVDYTIIKGDSVRESWTTIFEVEYKFLREEVGQHLITFKR